MSQNTGRQPERSVTKQRERLLFHVGNCTTKYQSIEDSLPELFTLVSRQSDEASAEMFSIVRGLENRLRLISSVASDQSQDFFELWSIVRPEIKWAFDKRNDIAHSVSAFFGAELLASIRDPQAKTQGRDEIPPGEFVMIKEGFGPGKLTRSDDLVEICDRIDRVSSKVLALIWKLKGQPLPIDWVEVWDHPIVRKWAKE